MTKDYRRLWKSAASTIDEAKAVRTLAEILVDKEGRAFLSRLERKDAELCIEILDHVSRDLRLLVSPSQAGPPGHRGAQPQIYREAGFFHYVDEACWILWTTAGLHDNNRKDRSRRQDTRIRRFLRHQTRAVHGTPCRSEDLEGYRPGRFPEVEGGEHQRYFLRHFGCSRLSFSSNSASKSSSGARYLIQTS